MFTDKTTNFCVVHKASKCHLDTQDKRGKEKNKEKNVGVHAPTRM